MNEKSIIYSVRETASIARLNMGKLEDITLSMLYHMVEAELFTEAQQEALADYLGTLFQGIGTLIDECEKAIVSKYGEAYFNA